MTQSIEIREAALIDAFVVPAKRQRCRLLLSHGKRRKKFLDSLNHFNDLDPRYTSEISAKTDVVELLQSHGAPPMCHVISDVVGLDGREMPLTEAVSEAEVGMWGTLIGCIPGRLAYYFGEAGEQRLLLRRHN